MFPVTLMESGDPFGRTVEMLVNTCFIVKQLLPCIANY
jgi:hypothetical protein